MAVVVCVYLIGKPCEAGNVSPFISYARSTSPSNTCNRHYMRGRQVSLVADMHDLKGSGFELEITDYLVMSCQVRTYAQSFP